MDPGRIEETTRILFVDDDRAALRAYERLLHGEHPHWAVRTAASVEDAKALLCDRSFDAIVTDLCMPGESGFALLAHVRDDPALSHVPVIVLTGRGEATLKRQALESGAFDLLNKPIGREDLLARLRTALSLKRHQDELLNLNRSLEATVGERTRSLERAKVDILICLAVAGEYRDSETGHHLLRVARFSRTLAEKLGCSKEDAMHIARAAPLHDIGKIGVPDAILRKPGPLLPDERREMERHCEIGHAILRAPRMLKPLFDMSCGDAVADDEPTENVLLDLAAEIALMHHERWDGAGYPCGMRGEAIPRSARIVAVADVYDALTSCRPYKPAMEHSAAARIIREESGTHLDPEVVDAFTACETMFESIRREFAGDALSTATGSASLAFDHSTPAQPSPTSSTERCA